jgi:hypothetical protein
MDLREKKHPMHPLDREAKMSGVGANAIWDGPLDTTGYPKGQGYSAGKNGIKLRFDDPSCGCDMPITQKAKMRR